MHYALIGAVLGFLVTFLTRHREAVFRIKANGLSLLISTVIGVAALPRVQGGAEIPSAIFMIAIFGIVPLLSLAICIVSFRHRHEGRLFWFAFWLSGAMILGILLFLLAAIAVAGAVGGASILG